MRQSRDVDEYIVSAPKEIQAKLTQLRATIQSVAPKAKERISYGMPYYEYKGRLAYFTAFKKHISMFAVPPIIDKHKLELKMYKISKSTIQFPLDKKLPLSLIKKLVKARMKINEGQEKKK